MTLTLELPDEIALALSSRGDLSRRALEALALEGYRQEALSQSQVGKLLGLSRTEAEDFLAGHTDLYRYDSEELHREAEVLEAYARRNQR